MNETTAEPTESTGRNFAAEFVGTTIVMLGGPGLIVLGSASIGPLGVALGFGLAIAIAIGVIGAVANPMFSLALLFARAITLEQVLVDFQAAASDFPVARWAELTG